ncbi:unnamed protein product [Prunus armeniaca]|uniref:Uncharacterized protein n=1 Tax=Prunus armeniaca TaxID=36596 RepID=A0A6J5X5M7_PRUAR|nr:unnamed protein product [Prunus armeniaca]
MGNEMGNYNTSGLRGKFSKSKGIEEILVGKDDLGRLYLLVTRLGNQSHCSRNIDEEVESLRKKFAGSQADRKEEREEAEAVKVAAQLKKTKVSGLLGAGLSTHEQMDEVRHE